MTQELNISRIDPFRQTNVVQFPHGVFSADPYRRSFGRADITQPFSVIGRIFNRDRILDTEKAV